MNEPASQVNQKQSRFLYILIIYIYTQLDLKSWMIANQKEKQPKPKSNCRKSSCLSLLHPRETSQCCIIASLLLTQWCWGWLSKRSVHMLWVKQGFLHAMSSDLLLYEMRKNMMVKTSQGTREKERRERERENRGRIPMECAAIVAKKQSNPNSTQNTKLLNPNQRYPGSSQAFPVKAQHCVISNLDGQAARSSQGLTAWAMWCGRCVNQGGQFCHCWNYFLLRLHTAFQKSHLRN